ncbi:uncharacterized protein TNCV_4908711 [Trichonephila clavipes]|uniref:Uncharacterized protein n=1 Tax=Trichonephila clavipes TaxID=2585209 RepID=A0A8X6RNQ6_TRICX|nr:uncharacterized protein TNCV_4908711 [Trichonephila clavipes]
MGHEDELTTDELQEILNEEHQETRRNMSPSGQEEDKRGPMPTSAIKDLLKKREDVRAMVLEWHPYQADVSSISLHPVNDWKGSLVMSKVSGRSKMDMFKVAHVSLHVWCLFPQRRRT